MPKALTRGVRNNNPGNIRWSNDNWLGLVQKNLRTDASFCQFTDPKWGIRALAIVLLNYRKKSGQSGIGGHGIDTIREIISRWAPATENNTEAYILSVAQYCDVGSNIPVDMTKKDFFSRLIAAIIRHENAGYEYPKSLIDEAIKQAYSSVK